MNVSVKSALIHTPFCDPSWCIHPQDTHASLLPTSSACELKEFHASTTTQNLFRRSMNEWLLSILLQRRSHLQQPLAPSEPLLVSKSSLEMKHLPGYILFLYCMGLLTSFLLLFFLAHFCTCFNCMQAQLPIFTSWRSLAASLLIMRMIWSQLWQKWSNSKKKSNNSRGRKSKKA